MSLRNDKKKPRFTKKQKNWINTGIFLLIVLILFIVNNSGSEPEKGPYPPYYGIAKEQMLDLKEYKGKVVLVNFWATWASSCMESIPTLIEVKKKFGADEFEIIGVSLDGITRGGTGLITIPSLIQKTKINYPIVQGTETTAYSFGQVRSIPKYYLIDKEGYIVEYFDGKVTRETLEKKIESLMKNDGSKRLTKAPELVLPIIK